MIKYIGNDPGMLELEAKAADPCNNCKNGPKPRSWCIGCRNFALACKLHDVDPASLKPTKTDMTETTPPATESDTCVYSEEQKEVIKQHLDFFCRIINFAVRNNMPFDKSKVAFLQSIFDSIVKTSKSQNLAETALSYYESTRID